MAKRSRKIRALWNARITLNSGGRAICGRHAQFLIRKRLSPISDDHHGDGIVAVTVKYCLATTRPGEANPQILSACIQCVERLGGAA
jgi:hypothetical protein